MSRRMKIWFIIGAALILLGSVGFAAVMTVNRWDFTRLNTVSYETNTYPLTESVRNISVKTNVADVVLIPSEDGTCRVICHEEENDKHSVTLKNGTLTVEIEKTKKWYDYIGIAWGDPTITVCLPAGAYGSLSVKGSTGDVEIPKDFSFESVDIAVSTGSVEQYASVSGGVRIKTSTGNIRLSDLRAGNVSLSVSTGRVTVSGVSCTGSVKIGVSTGECRLVNLVCGALFSEGGTGDMILENVISDGKIEIERSTGDVTLEKCDAAELAIETDTGDVTGSLLSGKIFYVESDTGHIDVPRSEGSGVCEIETDTGDIQITVMGKS